MLFKDSNAGHLNGNSLIHACLHAEYELASEVCAHTSEVAAAYLNVIFLIRLEFEGYLNVLRTGYRKTHRILIGDEIEYRRTGYRFITD